MITWQTGNESYPGTGAAVTVNAGDIIIVGCAWNNTAGDSGVSDTQSNGYTNLQNTSASTGFTRQMVWYAIAGSSGSVTCNVSGGFSDMGMWVDVFRPSTGTNLNITSGAHTGTANPDTITLTTYAAGAVWASYASESTPVGQPSGNNTTQIRWNSGHAHWQGKSDNLGSGGSLAFGYNPGTVQNNQNLIGVQMGNPPFGASKTQGATARIQVAVTKTQSATARIATIRTKTQSAVARVGRILTKTQTSTANIVGAFKNQTAKARIAVNLTFTQSAVGRIAKNFTKTQTSVSRISQTYTKAQTARANVGAPGSKTQTATARIIQVLTKTQTATAKILQLDIQVKAWGFIGRERPKNVANIIKPRAQ